ncbi:hypothetical protein [Pedobacter heparinus]|uniref:Uncharacterized protein n=1 Tax=Pedobacter heparinus (strain ATCC 13125 / DSM 2366 / CIP 104194 / JCM 7457 / NBRC 12017 / NCIMB 9290 / NRRL B-14731 / HIM 762-3) TaxID=485917 RepID=C6XUM9_PEDHD|nr:hypothetical protein [Pedobacter heparinus]ACU03879.1 hypothetical protein Phep_1668 [Pedobacter heparinus DSM 2366]
MNTSRSHLPEAKQREIARILGIIKEELKELITNVTKMQGIVKTICEDRINSLDQAKDNSYV